MEPILTVLKSPTCGCCEMDEHHDNGFSTAVEELKILSRAQLGIGPFDLSYGGVAQGFVFEGHVLSKFIHAFWLLRSKAASNGVPGMPVGTPYGGRRSVYALSNIASAKGWVD